MRFISGTILLLLILGCSKQEAEIPTYLSVAKVELQVDGNQGSNSNEISEIWVYADTQFVGTYSPPAKFPILTTNTFEVQVFAGIRQNGIGSDIAIYPFYEPYSTAIPEGGIFDLQPIFRYRDETRFAQIEDFEGSNALRTDLDGNDETGFEVTSVDALEGRSARAVVSVDNAQIEAETQWLLQDLPADGRAVYLELDYWSDTDLQVGFRRNQEFFYLLQLFPNNQWKKVYVDLTETLRGIGQEEYQIRFRAQHDGSTSADQRILIDNLKLIHSRK